MKKQGHPEYFETAKVSCACGNTFTVGSTMKEVQIEVCSACHPFYTGKQKFLDTARRLEKFKERAEKKTTSAATRKGKKVKKATRAAKKATKA